MSFDYSTIQVSVTKPKSKLAKKLAKIGMQLNPIEEEGNIDRYIISERLVIERRTGSSLLNGIMDKTLFTSAVDMREFFEIPMLIMEGEVNFEYTQFSKDAVRGALTSMMIEYGINIMYSPDVDETEALICMIARQEQIGVPEISFIPKRKAIDIYDMQRRVIEMLPGCGRFKAKELLQTFGSVKRIVNASPEEFESIKGLGSKKVEELTNVLNLEYEAIDFEKDLENAIEYDHSLLFDQPIKLLERQHLIFTEEKDKHIIDLVFLIESRKEVILVELKRTILTSESEKQLVRYLENADQSKLLLLYLKRGYKLRGMLATYAESDYTPKDNRIEAKVISEKRVIEILKKIRKSRLDKEN